MQPKPMADTSRLPVLRTLYLEKRGSPLDVNIYGGPSVYKRPALSESDIARSPRADAQRNRERLLATALKLFTSSKKEVTLSAVAERAGVGIGTLYRHFPTRDALVEAVYRHEVERLSDAAPALLKKMPAEKALEEWLTRYVGLVAAKRGSKKRFGRPSSRGPIPMPIRATA